MDKTKLDRQMKKLFLDTQILRSMLAGCMTKNIATVIL